MSDVEFARPWLLAGLPVLLVLAGMWYWARVRNARRGRTLSRVAQPPGPRFAPLLLALAAASAIVAGAQPQWGERVSSLPRNGAELVIVLDVSRSMDARDVAPSRIEATKTSLNQVLDVIGGDRVGLVVFAGSARLRMPLTSDLAAARQVINSLETSPVLLKTGTDAAAGLDLALSAFDLEREAGRVVLLITDGDDLGGDPATSLQALQAAGIDLIVAGAGTTDGAGVPVFDSASQGEIFKPDAAGAPIVTRLNEDFLRIVAAAANGRYLGSDLSQMPGAVLAKLSARQQVIVDEQESTFPVERFQWFAGAALAAIVLVTVGQRLFARIGRRGALTGVGMAVLALLPGCATEVYSVNERGRAALESGDTGRAIELFLEARALTPNDGRVGLNLATAYTVAGQHEDAKQAARRVLLSRDDRQRAAAQALIGRAEFAEEQLPLALASFKRALTLQPSNDDFRHDYEVVLRLLIAQQEEQQDPDPTDGDEPPGGSPTADPGTGSPGPDGTPGPGVPDPNATPGPDGTPDPNAPPGQGPPGPPQPGPPQPDTSSGGTGAVSPEALENAIRALDARIAGLQAEAGEEITTAEAIEILRLIAERSRLSAQRDAFTGNNNPLDY